LSYNCRFVDYEQGARKSQAFIANHLSKDRFDGSKPQTDKRNFQPQVSAENKEAESNEQKEHL
jgi:hypothetical protein